MRTFVRVEHSLEANYTMAPRQYEPSNTTDVKMTSDIPQDSLSKKRERKPELAFSPKKRQKTSHDQSSRVSSHTSLDPYSAILRASKKRQRECSDNVENVRCNKKKKFLGTNKHKGDILDTVVRPKEPNFNAQNTGGDNNEVQKTAALDVFENMKSCDCEEDDREHSMGTIAERNEAETKSSPRSGNSSEDENPEEQELVAICSNTDEGKYSPKECFTGHKTSLSSMQEDHGCTSPVSTYQEGGYGLAQTTSTKMQFQGDDCSVDNGLQKKDEVNPNPSDQNNVPTEHSHQQTSYAMPISMGYEREQPQSSRSCKDTTSKQIQSQTTNIGCKTSRGDPESVEARETQRDVKMDLSDNENVLIGGFQTRDAILSPISKHTCTTAKVDVAPIEEAKSARRQHIGNENTLAVAKEKETHAASRDVAGEGRHSVGNGEDIEDAPDGTTAQMQCTEHESTGDVTQTHDTPTRGERDFDDDDKLRSCGGLSTSTSSPLCNDMCVSYYGSFCFSCAFSKNYLA